MERPRLGARRIGALAVAGAAFAPGTYAAFASDHLDTPTVIADPAADIGDVFAWMSPDGQRLNAVMTIVGRRFSDRLQYVFHVGSGARFGETTATTSIVCRFDAASAAECWAGDADYVRGDARGPDGREGRNHRFRVFAGLRDDPFFNNVKGVRSAITAAKEAMAHGVDVDPAGCPVFAAPTSNEILGRLRQSEGGPGANFLAGWTTAALVVSVDRDVVDAGGPLIAVWGAVYQP